MAMGNPRCKRCDTRMESGLAMGQTFVAGTPDFPGDEHASTFSAGGPGQLIECWKCPHCGHSVSMGPNYYGVEDFLDDDDLDSNVLGFAVMIGIILACVLFWVALIYWLM